MNDQYDVFDVVCPYCGETSFGILLKPNTIHRIICPKCGGKGCLVMARGLFA